MDLSYLLTHDPVVAALVVVVPALAVATLLVVGIAATVLHFQTRPGRKPGDTERAGLPLGAAVPAGEPPALAGTAWRERTHP